jgi:phosphoribosyl-ATP pyrophosphohydrolase/phosphoribosyl-AMP cyclohydrolase
MSDIIQNFDFNLIKFDEDGLIPVIACDAKTNRILMQAYANREALELSLKTRYAHYYSRSRKELWKKGGTSGHVQYLDAVIADCDYDSVLYRVYQTGFACHTNVPSCFFNIIKEFSDTVDPGVLIDTEEAILDRRLNPAEGSYTNYLFSKGREKICKKVAEESGEVIIAAMKGDNTELINEAADLLYHLTVLLNERGTNLESVFKILKSRRRNEREKEY